MKEIVRNVAFQNLRDQCLSKAKTQSLSFSSLKPQGYLRELYPTQAKAIFQCRSKTLDIKEHRQYIYKDMVCRVCKAAEETLEHVINCGCQEIIDISVLSCDDLEFPYENKLLFTTIASRISSFMEEIKENNGV